MNQILAVMSALSDPTRLSALMLIWDGQEHCVCELMKALTVTQSRMSRHMQVLKQAGLVTDRRDAQWVRYRKNPQIPPAIAHIVTAVLNATMAVGAEERAA